jgi:hypothetical protein
VSFQHGSRCFDTQVQAWESLAAAEVGAFRANEGTLYVTNVSGVTAAGIAYELVPVVPGTTVSFVAAPSMQQCTLLHVEEAQYFGWAIAAAWIGILALRLLARGAK